MPDALLVIGTRKGLFLARSRDDRATWELNGPHFPMDAVYAAAIDVRRSTPRLLVGATSGHWGPTVYRSDDLGTTWDETEGGAVRFPAETKAALKHLWQLHPAGDPAKSTSSGCDWPASIPEARSWRTSFGVTRQAAPSTRRQWVPGFGARTPSSRASRAAE